MTQDDGGYDMKPVEKPAAPPPEGDGAGGAGEAGARAPRPGEPGWVPPVPVVEKADESPDETADPDVEKNKGMAVLAYICFIVPLVAAPKSKFARFHANQGLLTFICWCAAILGVVALTVFDNLVVDRLREKVAILYGFFTCAVYLLEPALLIGALILTLYGIIQAANGQRTTLPIVGQVTLIK
jgi:uncharacterized membrane protein